MAEVFKPRKNMKWRYDGWTRWECRDKNDNLVCDGGPSIIWDEGKGWQFYISGIGLRRLDGPAISDGRWMINNKNITKEIHDFAEENDIDLNNLTDAEKVLIALRFS